MELRETKPLTMDEQIEQLAKWGEPQRLNTKNGPRIVRKAPASDRFWNIWKTSKELLKKAGISAGKNYETDEWEVTWWQEIPEEEINALNNAIKQSVSTETDFQPPKPANLKHNYFGYQRAGIEFMKDHKNVLLADDMGLGKTIQGVGLANVLSITHSKMRVLVICPATVKENWKIEINKWQTADLSIGIVNGKGWVESDIVIINSDILVKYQVQLLEKTWDLLIVDEAHNFKTPTAQRSKVMLAIKAERKVYMTGTPILNRLRELFTLINSLDPDRWPSWPKFRSRYINAKLYYGRDYSEELQRILRSTIMVRRLKQDVLKDLPPKIHQTVILPVEMTERLREIINREKEIFDKIGVTDEEKVQELIKADLENLLRDVKSDNSWDFDEIARIRHEIGQVKVPYAIQHIHDIVDEDQAHKLVIFAHHKDVIVSIVKEFGDRVVCITGTTPVKDRQGIVERFQTDPNVQIFVGNIKAAGVGITLTSASHVIFTELDWVPALLEQAADRCHRIGQLSSVLVQYLVIENSIDYRIAEAIAEKTELARKTLNTSQDNTSSLLLEVKKREEVDLSGVLVSEEVARKQVMAKENLTDEIVHSIHFCLRWLRDSCDGARERDGEGFNKYDSLYGRDLANKNDLTPTQAVHGRNIIRKYRYQLPEDVYAIVFPGTKGGN